MKPDARHKGYVAYATLDSIDIRTHGLSPFTHLTLAQTCDDQSECMRSAFACIPHAFWLVAVDVQIFQSKFGVVLDVPEVARQDLARLFDWMDVQPWSWRNGKTAHVCCRSHQEALSLIGKSLCFSTILYKQVGRTHKPLVVQHLPFPHPSDPLTVYPRE